MLLNTTSTDDLERTRNQQATHLARSLEHPMNLAETIARDLLVHGRVVTPDERIATALAIDADTLRAAAQDMLEQPPTLAPVGRAGRGDHHTAGRRYLARG